MRFCAYLLLLGLSVGACSYLPQPEALPAGSTVREDRTTIVITTTRSASSTTGLLFYPGALVDPHAYVGLMQRLADAGRGQRIFIAKVPANLAVIQPQAADAIIGDYPDVKNWIIAGHSLGGAMACRWVRLRPESVRGLVLLAAYPAATDDLSSWSGGVLSLYGTLDGVLDQSALTDGLTRLPARSLVVSLAGGNHAQFGNYGEQNGDGRATISREEQQSQTTLQFTQFMNALGL